MTTSREKEPRNTRHEQEETSRLSTTTFTRVPHWLILKGVSGNALRLYVALGKYANNETGKAWPGIERLMADLNASRGGVKNWTKELADLGALTVEERRRPGKASATNMYTLLLEDPDASRSPESGQQGKGGGVTAMTPWGHSGDPKLDPGELNPSSYTPRLAPGGVFPGSEHEGQDQAPELPGDTRARLRGSLMDVGRSIKDGHPFHDKRTQERWKLFTDLLEAETAHLPYADALADLATHEWSVTAKTADPYEAGTQLNKLLNTARRAG